MGLTLFVVFVGAVACVRGRLDAGLWVGMFPRMLDRISKMAIIIGSEFDNIVANAQDRRTIIGQGRIARMKIVEP
jgi:hypothetical protein